MIDYATIMPDVAEALWGPRNKARSTDKEWRWGTNGARSVDLTKGVWFNHETKENGGVIDLLKQQGHDPFRWLRERGFDKTNGFEKKNGFDGNSAPKQYSAQSKSKSTAFKIIATYDYVDETGTLEFQVCRLDPKEFRQRRRARPDDDPAKIKSGFVWTKKGTRNLPYDLPALKVAVANRRPIFIPEGEKDVDALKHLGFDATCNAEGAGKWPMVFGDYFIGADVVVLPDNDDAGRKHADDIVRSLMGKAGRIRCLELPGLPEKGDCSDWFAAGGTIEEFNNHVAEAPVATVTADSEAKEELTPPLTISEWLDRNTPDPDHLMGSVFSTTTRALIFAPTGIGKTMMTTALGFSMAAGTPFLHWDGRRPAKVLFVDGELSKRLMKRRIVDAVNRFGSKPAGFHILSFDDIEKAMPVNTPEGQQIIERTIERIGGIDFIILDSVMALTAGSMKEEDSWAETLPWARSLTQRSIGQLWVHHTGHDESRGYGTKTREWGMDVVGQLERIDRTDTDVSFKLSFPKARERTPESRADFQSMAIALVEGEWVYEPTEAGKTKTKINGTAKRFFDALMNVLATGIVRTISGRKACTMDHWQTECVVMGLIDQQAKPDSARAMFSKYRQQLIGAGLVACEGNLAWKI